MLSTIIIYPYYTWTFDAAAYIILAAAALKLAIIGLILLGLWAFKPEALKNGKLLDILAIAASTPTYTPYYYDYGYGYRRYYPYGPTIIIP